MRIKEDMPELPQQKAKKFVEKYKINEYDSLVLCSNKELGDLFESLVQKEASAELSAKLLTRELLAVLNHDSLTLKDVEINVNAIYDLIELMDSGKVSDKNVKQSMINYISGDKQSPKEYLEKNNLLISEEIDIDGITSAVLENNASAIDDYKAGNEKVLNFLAGLIMRETKGAARIDQVLEKLKEKISD